MTKDEARTISSFCFRHSFVIRHSTFDILKERCDVD